MIPSLASTSLHLMSDFPAASPKRFPIHASRHCIRPSCLIDPCAQALSSVSRRVPIERCPSHLSSRHPPPSSLRSSLSDSAPWLRLCILPRSVSRAGLRRISPFPLEAMSSNVGSAQSPAVESWDDDFQNEGDAPFTSNFGHALSSAKHSLSSRLSTRSASNAGDDDWELPIDSSKSSSATDAISSAKEAGIPIPSNVPSSALLGGAIKRLGGKRRQAKHVYDDWAEDLDLPTDPSAPLQLKPLAAASTTAALDDDFDDSWAEGSLGVRFAGTRRDSKNRSSSASAMSPSLASNLTMESEDDTMTGLVLPPGPLDFTIALKRRQAEQAAAEPSSPSALDSPLEPSSATTRPFSGQQEGDDDDFFADLDIGNGDLVDPRKRKLHLNVKSNANKFPKSSGAVPKTQTSITFTERATTRIPRPVSLTKPHRLEPVLEAGATTSSSRPRRLEPTTTSAQLLRAKRSMPALRATPPVLNKAPSVPSLISGHAHPLAANRPLHLHTRRESDGLRPRSPTIRSHSRMSSMGAPPDTPTRSRRDVAPATLAREAAAKRTITKPVARKHFGNGTELDNLDDLPTSATKENRYVKQPITRAPATKPIRSQNSQSRLGMRDKSCTPQPSLTPFSSTSQENLPRFARDTAASRIAREQTLAQPARARGDAPLAPKTNWAAQVAARSPYNSPQSKRTVRRMPNLINPMGKENIHHCTSRARARMRRDENANDLL